MSKPMTEEHARAILVLPPNTSRSEPMMTVQRTRVLVQGFGVLALCALAIAPFFGSAIVFEAALVCLLVAALLLRRKEESDAEG